MTKKVFLDANVLLEILCNRPKSNVCKEFFLDDETDLYVSILTIHIVHYFAKKSGINLELTVELLKLCKVCKSSEIDYKKALELYIFNKDLEDALQVAIALNNSMDSLVTLDIDLVKKFSKKINLELVQL